MLNASDRPILVNSGFGNQSGSYNLAYRVLGLALTPSLAMMRASTKRLFHEGDQGIRGPFRVARKLSVPTAAIGIVIGSALWIGAPLIRIVIDDKFPEVVSVIRWLAVLPFIKSLQFVFGNALDASANQIWRFRLTLSAAALNLVLNLILIPRYSWRAAVGTTVLAESLLTITTIAASWLLARRDARLESNAAPTNPAAV
ncbi:MAG: polysaccharide biosynthesis C-terminal domain-containing protein [Acidimicrobiales bacterium]